MENIKREARHRKFRRRLVGQRPKFGIGQMLSGTALIALAIVVFQMLWETGFGNGLFFDRNPVLILLDNVSSTTETTDASRFFDRQTERIADFLVDLLGLFLAALTAVALGTYSFRGKL